MKPLSLTDVSSDLAGIIDRATDDHEPVLITRGDRQAGRRARGIERKLID